LPLAQAIGRLGNWFNQELYGGPSDLPWALEIDPEHRVAGYESVATFHPTFLYEALWNLALVGLLIWLDSKRVLRPGRIFAVYVGGYFLGRLWVESLRVDTASELLGLRVNIFMSLVGIAASVIFLIAGGLTRREGDSDALYHDDARDDTAPEAARPDPDA
jgi:prolipoprotein diacylglyceryl transferase